MRIHAVSDIHVDYEENFNWIKNLSNEDYTNDVLILAGDVSDNMVSLGKVFTLLKNKFFRVLFVPGNHDLWVTRNKIKNSMEALGIVQDVAVNFGIDIRPADFGPVSIVPLLGWYDYSFGMPGEDLKYIWMDYDFCVWPDDMDVRSVTRYFVSLNEGSLNIKNRFIITFSHFLPRIDIMPLYIPLSRRIIYPVLGTNLLEKQIRVLKSNIHIYGHSHVNRKIERGGIVYINNAYGYPNERRIAKKTLLCIYET